MRNRDRVLELYWVNRVSGADQYDMIISSQKVAQDSTLVLASVMLARPLVVEFYGISYDLFVVHFDPPL